MGSSTTISGKRGIDLLRAQQLSKSAAFTEAKRDALGLTGLLPAGVDSEENQVHSVLQQLGQKNTNLERFIYLIALLDTDETLFCKVVMAEPARFLPILYDLTSNEVPAELDADDPSTAAHTRPGRADFTYLLRTSVSCLASAGSAVYRCCGRYRGWRWGARIGSFPVTTAARGRRIGRFRPWRVK